MVRDRSCSSKPHLGGLKLGPCTTSGAQKKSASEASYIDMEVQRPKEGDVQRELYLQSLGGELTAPYYLIQVLFQGSQFDKLII